MFFPEAIVVLDLVNTVACNMKNVEEGRLIMCVDCRKVWELLTADSTKASLCVGDEGAIISKTLMLEMKSKV